MLQVRSGWDASASLFSAHFPPNLNIDHAPSYFGEFQLYRRGEWAITHPLGYGAFPSFDGRGTNSMLVGGLPWGLFSFAEYRQALAADWTEDWAFIAGTAWALLGLLHAGEAAPEVVVPREPERRERVETRFRQARE